MDLSSATFPNGTVHEVAEWRRKILIIQRDVPFLHHACSINWVNERVCARYGQSRSRTGISTLVTTGRLTLVYSNQSRALLLCRPC